MTPPAPSEMEGMDPTQSVTVPLVEAQKQPGTDNRLGSSYITEPQVTQIENISCDNSISSSDSLPQEYLKNQINEQLNDKVYNTFKELFQGINIDSMKEALPKVSIYNSIIAKFAEEINSKYGMSLRFTTLEPHKVGNWAKTFQVASGSNQAPSSPRPWQAQEEPCRSGPQQTVTEQPHQLTSQPSPTIAVHHHIPPQIQAQQEEINKLTNMVAQWSAGNHWRLENNYNAHRHRYIHNHSTPNMSPVVPDFNNHIYYDNQGWQGNCFEWQVPEQRFSHAPYNNTNVDNHTNVNSPNSLNVWDSYSSKQAITQTTLNSIPKYDWSNKVATILWLDHTEMVAENTDINLLKVGISKLKGLALGDITAIHKKRSFNMV